jgi:hypothetical protein
MLGISINARYVEPIMLKFLLIFIIVAYALYKIGQVMYKVTNVGVNQQSRGEASSRTSDRNQNRTKKTGRSGDHIGEYVDYEEVD